MALQDGLRRRPRVGSTSGAGGSRRAPEPRFGGHAPETLGPQSRVTRSLESQRAAEQVTWILAYAGVCTERGCLYVEPGHDTSSCRGRYRRAFSGLSARSAVASEGCASVCGNPSDELSSAAVLRAGAGTWFCGLGSPAPLAVSICGCGRSLRRVVNA